MKLKQKLVDLVCRTAFRAQLSELRNQVHELRQCLEALLRRVANRTPLDKKQERFNGEVVEILDLILTEIRRMREGKTLSNLAGIEKQVKRLESEMQFR